MSSNHKKLSYNQGIVYALGAYVAWGLFPIYWKAITGVPAVNVLAHRIVWSFVFLLIWVLLTNRQTFINYVRQPRLLLRLGLAGCLISINWGIYIYAVASGHIVEAGLGYYINPLVNVFLGYVFLKERLATMQKIAVVLALIGVVYFTVSYGQFPWISLLLAISFGLYGLLKKKANLESMPALTIETMMVFPIALTYLIYTAESAVAIPFFPSSGITSALLILGGLVTAIPLFWFGKSAQVIPLSTMGFIQYLNPTLQLLLGIFVYGETFGIEYGICFAFVWAGLICYTISILKGKKVRIAK
ncbi:chloramphenicol-sensitive protein RarD [Parabacteroides sp. PFB2-12]|uniref:EamA family transporter RarD n=1 Tax=unclassified Parabacteroides TaxID=2649774 RepID=UPI002474C67C|nr:MULTISPECIES: EamA family transporter RarD [unclassified Parabacteroides]MDH6341944.1 chloramphenicol-sensitive protein RarD [Parabacteroides sp. PM6-13]MDH6389642.1 chloramphenicol-sensitive protein RarD [Parabacteroides sp. PFB2-12]